MSATVAKYVDEALRAAGVPLIGVTVGDVNNRATWIAQLTAGATPSDHATAAATIAAFDLATIPALHADSDAVVGTTNKVVRALVVYIWKVTHAGVNPTGPQLTAELATLKAIYKALS